MKHIIRLLILILGTLNVNAQKKEVQSHILETYTTSDQFLQDSSSLKLLYEINTIKENYIHIKRKLNPTTKKKDKGKYYGFKYKGKKYYNLLWSESSNQHLYLPLEVEGFFSLILMPVGEVNARVPAAYSMGILPALILEKQARSVWKDKDGKAFYIMILEPNIKGSAYAFYSSASDKKVFGVYMSNVSRKRYNRKFGFNLEKRETKVEDWIDVVNNLNTRHKQGDLDYTEKQKEAAAEQEKRDAIKPYSESKKEEYVPYSQRNKNK